MLKNMASRAIALALVTLSPLTQADERVDYLDSVPYLITTSDPGDPQFANTPGNPNFRSGVGSIFIQFAGTAPGGFICTASAISPTHILTAAHCVRNTNPDGSVDVVSNILFVLPSTGSVIGTTGFSANPTFDFYEPLVGAFAPGDVAVIELAEPIPAGVETYELYRDSDELMKETQHYGHGRIGVGETGATGDSDFFYGRTGKNRYDEVFAPLIGIPFFEQLIHDFDDGTGGTDASPWWYSPAYLCPASHGKGVGNAVKCNVAKGQGKAYRDKGYGALEVGIAPGDSGGPGFVDGKIAGVHSFGFTYNCGGVTGNAPDVTCGLDSSYGEMAGDARVSINAAWIDAQLANGVTTPIPEPFPVAAASGSTSDSVELSAQAQYVISNSVARHLRLKVEMPAGQ
jgi:hypothetical protein